MRYISFIITILTLAVSSLTVKAQAIQDSTESQLSSIDSVAGLLPKPIVDSTFQAKFQPIMDSIYACQNYLMSASDTSIVFVPWRDTVVYKVDSVLLARLDSTASHSLKLALQDSLSVTDSTIVANNLPVAVDNTMAAMKVDSIATKLLRDSLDILYSSYWKLVDTLSLPLMDSIISSEYVLLESNLPDERDIKMAIKRNKQEYRDSVVKNTPRVLETFVLSDSLYYKSILQWTHSQYTNNIQLQSMDTTYNYNFYDNPAMKEDADVIGLGVVGSAQMNANFFKRNSLKEASFMEPYMDYTYTPETLPMYNTKAPYTELAYWGNPFISKEREESSVKILVTQNITPAMDLTLLYRQYGGAGSLANEKSNSRSAVIGINYLGKRYEVNAAYVGQTVIRNENGGVHDSFWIVDTTIDNKAVETNLKKASNIYKKKTLFLTQSLSIPMNFFRKDADSLALGEGTAAYIGHSLEYSSYSKTYTDQISSDIERSFYRNQFNINEAASFDSLGVHQFENKLFLTLQPFSNDAVLGKVTAGLGYQILTNYSFSPEYYLSGNKSNTFHNSYLYGQVEGMLKKYIQWDAFGKMYSSGYYLGDMELAANLAFSIYPITGGIHLKLHGESSLQEPGYFQKHIYMNHHQWNNDFSKVSTTKLEGSIEIPHTGTKAFFGYALMDNLCYYDSLSVVRQHDNPVHVMSAALEQNIKIWAFHFDHRLLFQLTSDSEVMPLPKFTANLRYYFQFPVVKNVLEMQLGANAVFHTKYYMQGYSPDLGVFYNQRVKEWGNNPYFDFFANMQWKQVSIFVKYTNGLYGWPGSDYFTASDYIRNGKTLKLGIFWPFSVK